jgi:hypothetical protein
VHHTFGLFSEVFMAETLFSYYDGMPKVIALKPDEIRQTELVDLTNQSWRGRDGEMWATYRDKQPLYFH